jgi:mRNA-degrading endonuclease RelE of RelBE toxin-antitoxin system
LTTRAKKDLKRLDKQNQAKVVAALEHFATTGEGNVIRLTNIKPPQYRLKEGDWRVRFKKHEKEQVLEILHVRHRSQAYSPRREKK